MAASKVCFKCQRELPLAEFYRHPNTRDGLLGKCKECARADIKACRANKADHYKQYDRIRNRDPKRRAATKAYMQSDRGPPARQRGNARYRTLNPLREIAHSAVAHAIRDGRLSPQPCEKCGSQEQINAHHDDYTKPLVVRWLCRSCHLEWHRHNRALPYTAYQSKITGEDHG